VETEVKAILIGFLAFQDFLQKLAHTLGTWCVPMLSADEMTSYSLIWSLQFS
jgi:hypothetical protein